MRRRLVNYYYYYSQYSNFIYYQLIKNGWYGDNAMNIIMVVFICIIFKMRRRLLSRVQFRCSVVQVSKNNTTVIKRKMYLAMYLCRCTVGTLAIYRHNFFHLTVRRKYLFEHKLPDIMDCTYWYFLASTILCCWKISTGRIIIKLSALIGSDWIIIISIGGYCASFSQRIIISTTPQKIYNTENVQLRHSFFRRPRAPST